MAAIATRRVVFPEPATADTKVSLFVSDSGATTWSWINDCSGVRFTLGP